MCKCVFSFRRRGSKCILQKLLHLQYCLMRLMPCCPSGSGVLPYTDGPNANLSCCCVSEVAGLTLLPFWQLAEVK